MLQKTSPCAGATCQTPPAAAPAAVAAVLGAIRPLALSMLRLIGRVRQEARRRATCRTLAALPDHALRDIGVDRADIRGAVLDQERERGRARLRAQAPSGGIERL